MAIYTRTGDRGKTSLFSGKRVYKDDLRVETYGTIDELNSLLGVAIAHISEKKESARRGKENKEFKKSLLDIQSDLFYIGSHLADLPDAIEDINLTEKIKQLELSVDKYLAVFPPITNFILPGGGKLGALLHLARTVTRRSERQLVRLSKKEKVDERVIKYINRLSDLLYAAARYANFLDEKKEIIWER